MSPTTPVARLWGCALFSAFGLCCELVFTGLKQGFAGSFLGEVSLLMIPVYSFAYLGMGPALRLLERHGAMGPARRLPLTVIAIYAVEWSFGAAYRALGLSPWHYDHGWASDFSGGHITLYYLPAWLVFAWLLVPVWRRVRLLAAQLAGRAAPAPPDRSPD